MPTARGSVTFTGSDWDDRVLRAPWVTTVTYWCTWRKVERILRYQGDCAVCGTRTWAADDGENDPRGIMGDHAAFPLVAADYDMVGPTIPRCFPCGDTYELHVIAERHAMRVWREREPST